MAKFAAPLPQLLSCYRLKLVVRVQYTPWFLDDTGWYGVIQLGSDWYVLVQVSLGPMPTRMAFLFRFRPNMCCYAPNWAVWDGTANIT